MSVDPEQDAYHELCGYTLTLGDTSFIHQHVVDTFAAQRADEHSKPIGVAFALIGLYLHVEKRWSGRQVQRAHMHLARQTRSWPAFTLPSERGSITPTHVMSQPEGPARDQAIHMWCASVWKAFEHHRLRVEDLLLQHGMDVSAR